MIDKAKVVEVFNGEGEVDAKAQVLLDMFKKDMDEQINGLLVNKEEILKEKREEADKRKKSEEALVSLKNKMKELEGQLEKNSPDEIKKIYESKLADNDKIYNGKVSELSATIDLQKQQITELKRVQLQLACMEEFNKAIAKKNIDPDAVNDFKDYVLGFDCCKFSERSLGKDAAGNEKTTICTGTGQTIESAVNAALETSFGKRCTLVNSSGGGAEGGNTSSGGPQANPWKKETWNLTQQMRLVRENPTEAQRLQRLANA